MDQRRIESVILENLLFNDEYSRKVVPFIQLEYFSNGVDKIICDIIKKFITEYNTLPSTEAISISLNKDKKLTEEEYKTATNLLSSLNKKDKFPDLNWLLAETEQFCKDKAVYNAIMESIHIIDGKSSTQTETAIPHILSDALSVSFDTHIGHDYIEDSDERYQFYHKVEQKVSFDLDFFNRITGGGTPQKTLNIVMAGTGVGKSLFMCHHAANCLTQNLNVLYITCEMAEERIAERIDANLMDITMDDLKDLPKQMYDKKLNTKTAGITGKLIIKEYPTATASSNNFRILLDELAMKKKFKPDIIFIDYLNICASARLKSGGNINTYQYVKSIAEELRGLAVEYNVPVWSATQTNRSGFSNTDVSLEDTSESFGLPATADFMFALIATEELDEQNQVLVKQLKNRYNDTALNRKFILGINRAKMKLSDVKKDQQFGLVQSNQSDTKTLGSGFDGESFDEKFKTSKEKFSEWKV
jgi:replicative DNA helicase|tara:strand:- start:1056 stop:2477 length:1422 start_codon:yes stop_codon:yes gene_type:complete